VKKLNIIGVLGLLFSASVFAAPTVSQTFSTGSNYGYSLPGGTSIDTNTHWFVFNVPDGAVEEFYFSLQRTSVSTDFTADLFSGNVIGFDFVKAGAVPRDFPSNAAQYPEKDADWKGKTFSFYGNYSTSPYLTYEPFILEPLEKGTYSLAISTYPSAGTISDVRMPGTYNFETNAIPISPVPEPETYAMMIAGLGVLGLLMRRKIKKQDNGFANPSSCIPA
jgi:hypothetical protein